MLRFILLLIASIGPGLLWLWYFYRKDRYEPEPLRMVLKIFLAGMLVVIPAGLIEQIWRGPLLAAVRNANWPVFLTHSFLVIALVEEGLKSLVLFWMIGHNREVDEPVDGMIYGITLGLGFASLENFLWVSAFGFGVALLRAVVTTLAHAAFTGWMGYFIAKYKFSDIKSGGILWTGFLLAWVTHGSYDFLLFLKNPIASVIAFFGVAVLIIRMLGKLKIQAENSPFRNS